MSKRYFLNNFDSILGQAILRELVKPDDEGDPTHMATYMDRSKTQKPKGIQKILKREKPQLSRKQMLEECDVYVYDTLFGEKENLIADINYVQSIFLDPNPPALEQPRTLILVSDVMSWSDSGQKIQPEKPPGEPGAEGEGEENAPIQENKAEEQKPVDQGEAEGQQVAQQEDNQEPKQAQQQSQLEDIEAKPLEYVAWEETDFQQRKSLEKYQYRKDLEDLLLSLKHEQVKVIIICSGILYGLGELTFHNHFKAAWLQNPASLPYLGQGNNLIPTIHITDLAQFIVKVAQSPPQLNYLFAFDNAPDRTQKGIVSSIAKNIGSNKVESVDSTSLISQEYLDHFQLDIWVKNSSLLLGTQENPVDFEWQFQKGLIGSTYKVLQQFWKTHKLRPIKILAYTPSQERTLSDSQYNQILEKFSQHYRIPIIHIQQVIEAAALQLSDDLGQDLREEIEKIKEYFAEGQERSLTDQKDSEIRETLQVLYRLVQWRLSQNDCMNRGYILDSFPLFIEQAQTIFFPQKNKLKRIKPQPKKKQGQASISDQPQLDDEQGNPQNQEDAQALDGQIQDGDKKIDQGEDQENQQADQDDAEKEGDQEPVAQEQEAEDENAPKIEFFYPQSFIFIKKLSRNRKDTHENAVFNYFSQRGQEINIYDASQKEFFETFENLRIYIERNGRPFNYLTPEVELQGEHFEFYHAQNNFIEKQKLEKKIDQEQKIIEQRNQREQISQDQINYILSQQNQVQVVQRMPFRNYLMQYVVPELNQGLLEVSNILPDDPIEFLAEFLFKKSFEFS